MPPTVHSPLIGVLRVSRLMLVSLPDGLICVRLHVQRARWPAVGGWVRRFPAGGGC